MRRYLQEVTGPAGAAKNVDDTYVTSAEELQKAVSAGARHILIMEHLDLTRLEIITKFRSPKILAISNNTWTIRVGTSSSC
jgi:hypothetical protein